MQTEETMKAYAAVSAEQLVQVELPLPEIDDYEVLVKNEGCLFCNITDRMIVEHLFHTPSYPTILGHEDFGIVVKVGKKVNKFKLGDRVMCANAIVRGFDGTYYSTWGGFAEYGVAGDLDAYLSDNGIIDEANFYRKRYAANSIIPGDLPPEKAALVFPMAETASALKQVGDLAGKSVVVIGTGFAGYAFVFFAKEYGAKNVVCIGRCRECLHIAEKLGADKTFIDVDEAERYIRAMGGADVVLEASGNPQALEKGLPYLKENGMLAVFDVSDRPYAVDLQRIPICFVFKKIEPEVEGAVDYVAELLRNEQFPYQMLLTHQWKWEEMPTGYADIKKGSVIKGLVWINQNNNQNN